MMNGDERFFAWLDGELTGAEADEMAARVASDPQLSALADRHRTMQARLAGALDEVAAASVPERLRTAASAGSSKLIDLAARRARSSAPGRLAGVPQWAAIAATLVLGIMIGTLAPRDGSSGVELRNGSIYASGELDRALDTQLASAPSGGAVRVGLTFRDSAGAICRTFTGAKADGLACRHSERWLVRGLFPSSEAQARDYRMASGMNPALAALLDSTMAGEPMDAAQEAEARKAGWR